MGVSHPTALLPSEEQVIKVSDVTMFGNELRYVTEAVREGSVSWHGRFVREFETAFAQYVGSKHALACCNGTAALHLALEAAGIGPGDEVIVPVLTYVATANAVRHAGARPVFVDVDPTTWCMNVDEADRAITSRTKAILPVQLYGHWPDMGLLQHICKRRQLMLIEDAAEALTAHWKSQHAGTFGIAGAFSFFANKTITCGEGGMVVTNSDGVADTVRRLRAHGMEQSIHQYYHDRLGYNYRMTNLQAAVGLAQLETLPVLQSRRVEVVHYYRTHLSEFEQQWSSVTAIPSNWMFTVLVPKGVSVTDVRARMAEDGVETRPSFLPLSTLPMYSDSLRSFPVASDISNRGLCLPTHAGLTVAMLAHVETSFRKALQEAA
jgi:perosamine synthetase